MGGVKVSFSPDYAPRTFRVSISRSTHRKISRQNRAQYREPNVSSTSPIATSIRDHVYNAIFLPHSPCLRLFLDLFLAAPLRFPQKKSSGAVCGQHITMRPRRPHSSLGKAGDLSGTRGTRTLPQMQFSHKISLFLARNNRFEVSVIVFQHSTST